MGIVHKQCRSIELTRITSFRIFDKPIGNLGKAVFLLRCINSVEVGEERVKAAAVNVNLLSVCNQRVFLCRVFVVVVLISNNTHKNSHKVIRGNLFRILHHVLCEVVENSCNVMLGNTDVAVNIICKTDNLISYSLEGKAFVNVKYKGVYFLVTRNLHHQFGVALVRLTRCNRPIHILIKVGKKGVCMQDKTLVNVTDHTNVGENKAVFLKTLKVVHHLHKNLRPRHV